MFIQSSIIYALELFLTASSATKELDDLMASLSDFRVSVQRDSRIPTLSPAQPSEPAPKKEPVDSGLVSKTADYARVDKPSVRAKAGQQLHVALLRLRCINCGYFIILQVIAFPISVFDQAISLAAKIILQ